MTTYVVVNAGGERLDLDGPLTKEDALSLAREIEREHNIEVMIVDSPGDE